MKAISVYRASFEDLFHALPQKEIPRYVPLIDEPPAWSGYVGEELVFLTGIKTLWQGVGEAWTIPGPCFRRYLEAPRTIRRLLHEAIEEFGYRRVQAQVDSTNETNLRFARWMGFTEECRFADYGPLGQDYIMMRWKR